MRSIVATLAVVGSFALCACGGGGGSTPAAPSATPVVATRIMSLGGNLAFGPVTVNTTASGLLTITNSGNSLLTVSSINGICGSFFSVTPSNGTVAPGATLSVTVRFTPTTATSCSGNLTVTADQTSGVTSIPIVASGTLDGIPIFTKSGFGNTVFDLPTYVARVHVTGRFVDTGGNSNFIVDLNGKGLINEILRNSNYDGISLTTGGGTIAITSSGSISWSFTEVRQ